MIVSWFCLLISKVGGQNPRKGGDGSFSEHPLLLLTEGTIFITFYEQKLFSRGGSFFPLYWNNMKPSFISSIIPFWAFYMFLRRKYSGVKLASIGAYFWSRTHTMDLKAFWSTIMIFIFHHANCTLSSK